MNLSGLLPLITALPRYRELLARLAAPTGGTAPPTPASLALNLMRAARPAVLAAFQRDLHRPLVAVTPQVEQAQQLYDEVRQWSPLPEKVFYFPAPEALPYDKIAWDPETIRRRITVLSVLAAPAAYPQVWQGEGAPLIVTSVSAILPKTIPPMLLAEHILSLRVGQRLDLNDFLTSLLRCGYQPTSVVEESGQFSRRGGIVDLYPPNQPHPLRIELFGDEIESLRWFDPATQRSLEGVAQVAIAPASEALPVYGDRAAQWAREADLSSLQAISRQRWEQDLESLSYQEAFRGIEFYLPYLYKQPASFLDFLPSQGLLAVDDLSALEGAARALIEQAEETRRDLVDEGSLPAGYPPPYFPWEDLAPVIAGYAGFSLGYQESAAEETSGLSAFGPVKSYGGELDELVKECKKWQAEGQRVVLVSQQTQRLNDLFREQEIYPLVQDEIKEPPPERSILLVQGSFASGWSLRVRGRVALSLLTDNEIFGWAKYRHRRRIRRRGISPETFFADLKEGDYVVHIEHGVGIYRGLVRKTIDNVEREYLELEYGGGDRLYVSVDRADRVARYVGVGETPPVLNRLGTADWERVKAKAKKAVQEIAHDLLSLYAARQVVPGHAFAPDSPWQAELEAAFPYQETEDQLKAIVEVKQDMERARPMDRLVCGDVGYGKTEVAIRAAFKAVMDGKQVAILVPTTVLAQQHYYTFRDRLEPFPVEVEMLSRFRTRAEQQRILERLANGQIDIIVGTHRLLQKDVVFKDLGLLIVDEEQRFGVAHKERLKLLRSQVDVLTLTATPIPRTLHMALTGVRDMSVIDTPPEERLPIRTQVAEYSDALVRKAILREKNRGGQVYFVHNRVQGIRQMAQRLKRIVPEVSIVIGHGQMPERELSQVMLDFIAGKYDVLLCTTIIESGLDIPNVNTIIINNADHFGLAQLYQLRGRVGRSSAQAYAYLLYSKGQNLVGAAARRLEAIMEASELGAGFQVAMRDLEIRGAGEILGARQHGHIAAVGFDLYTRLLAQAVRELKEKQGIPEVEARLPFTALSPVVAPNVDLPLSAHLPEDYVPDAPLRLRLYQRMANLRDLEELDAMSQELADRFGPPTAPVQNLLYLLRLKVLAQQAGVMSIAEENRQAVIRFASPDEFLPVRAAVQERFGRIATIRPAMVILPWGRGSSVGRQTLMQALEVMAEARRKKSPALVSVPSRG